jgi:hypothetical protein
VGRPEPRIALGLPGASIAGEFTARGAQPTHDLPPTYPLPASLAKYVDELLAAFDVPTPLDLSVSLLAPRVGAGFNPVQIDLGANAAVWGFALDFDQPLAGFLVDLGGGIQEHLAEQDETWGQARPPCPGHPHPAITRVCDGLAWWCCPKTGDRLQSAARSATRDQTIGQV